jgi:hypothetical protein
MNNDHHAAQPSSVNRTLTSSGGSNVFVAKYDRSGKLKWLLQAGGPGDDNGYDLALDGAGNVYVTGAFAGNSATFRGTNNTDQSVVGLGITIFLAKYTPSGALVWVQTGHSVSESLNQGFGVAVEPVSGSVYVTGVAQGESVFSSSNGTTGSVAGPWTWHMILAKYDTAGNFQWGQSNEAAPNSISHRVAVDADNNAYATGWMEGQTTFHSNDGQDQTVSGFSGPVQTYPDYPGDAFVVKYDEDGNLKWVNHVGGYKAIGTDIATSRDGQVSVTGFIGNIANSPGQAATIVTSQPGGNNINLGGGTFTTPYNKDVFLATYDDEGVLLNAQRFGGAKDDGGSAVAYDRHSKLILAGVFQDTIRIDGRRLTGASSLNLFVAKFARDERRCGPGYGTDSDEQHGFAANTLAWIKGANGPFIPSWESGPRVGLTARGDVLMTGAFQPTAQFGGFKLQSAGLQDGFLALLRAGSEDDEHRRHDGEHFYRD